LDGAVYLLGAVLAPVTGGLGTPKPLAAPLWGHNPLAYAAAYVLVLSEVAVLTPERHVKLFKNGRNQAVRIPREFELPGNDAIMRKDGNKLIIEAVPPRSLLDLLATLETLDDDFPPIVDTAPDEIEI
jgi:antitoxin VapB